MLSSPTRWLRFSRPNATPVAIAVTMPPYAAAVLATWLAPGRPRPAKRSTGQPVAFACASRCRPGLTAQGCPTADRKGTSSSPLEYAKLEARSTPWPAANARTASALPCRHSVGPATRPVRMPSAVTSAGVHSTCSIPAARAAGSTWNRDAEDASTSVWPIRSCARISCHASGNSRPAICWANSRSPSSASSSSDRPAQAAKPSATNRSKSASLVTPRRPSISVCAASTGPMLKLRSRCW